MYIYIYMYTSHQAPLLHLRPNAINGQPFCSSDFLERGCLVAISTDLYWLVVSTPRKNESVGMTISQWKDKHVPNHQPGCNV